MRRFLAALTALALALLLTACEPEGGTGDKPKPKPTAGAKQQPKGGGEANQPAPVQGDPGAHNTQGGEVDLHLSWTSANSNLPACEWSKNGVVMPCTSLKRAKLEGKKYYGLWEYTTSGKAGDTFSLVAQGSNGTESAECGIFWKAKPMPGEVHQGGRCSIQVTLP